jgi:uncharacterized protein YgfB (UPF0149 family)
MTAARLTYAVTSQGAVADLARRYLHGLGLTDRQIHDLAKQRDEDLERWELAQAFRDAEKALPEATRALRRVHTLILNGLQEEDADA